VSPAARAAVSSEGDSEFPREFVRHLTQEKLYLEEEIRSTSDFEGIIGQSSVLRQALQLAPRDSHQEINVLGAE
jgi:hypothetical protein